jgi:glycosyltransferase involved in cell wall biosynthesis
MTFKKLSIVAPVFDEAENIPEFLLRLRASLTDSPVVYEVLFCVDPSTDGTEELIREENRKDPRIKMLRFSRRFGQPAATMAGISLSDGDAVLVIDVDLQDPPEVIPEMIGKWLAGAPIVLARRTSRVGEPLSKGIVSRIGYSFLNKFADVPIPEDTGDFRLLDRQVVDELKRFPETNAFLRGLVAMVGFNTETVEFERLERFAGRTKYNRWVGSLRIGFNGVVGYSTALLALSTVVGISLAIIAVLVALGYALAKLAGADFPLGNPTIVTITLFLGGLILLSNGILGMYIGRIYDEVKRRPRFILQEALGLETSELNNDATPCSSPSQ